MMSHGPTTASAATTVGRLRKAASAASMAPASISIRIYAWASAPVFGRIVDLLVQHRYLMVNQFLERCGKELSPGGKLCSQRQDKLSPLTGAQHSWLKVGCPPLHKLPNSPRCAARATI